MSEELVCVFGGGWWGVKDGLSPCIPLRSDGLQTDAERGLLMWRWGAGGTERELWEQQNQSVWLFEVG